MTTMISKNYRQQGLFTKLAIENYNIASTLEIDFIMGFPNETSAPGFKKRLNWILPPTDYIVSISKDHLLEIYDPDLFSPPNSYNLNLHDNKTRKWRMSRPNAKYIWQDGLLYKEFEGSIDLMYFNSVDSLHTLPKNKKINLLLQNEITQLRNFKVFDYQFGGISINRKFDPSTINRQMCMSDIF